MLQGLLIAVEISTSGEMEMWKIVPEKSLLTV